MATIAWEMTHAVETSASPAFAWNYWTNVANWDDPPAIFQLEGPFVPGARGTTRLPVRSRCTGSFEKSPRPTQPRLR